MDRREGFHRIGAVVTVAYVVIAATICFLIAWNEGEIPRRKYEIETGGRRYVALAYSEAEAASLTRNFISTDCNYIGCEGMARSYEVLPIDAPAKARHDFERFWPPLIMPAAVALGIYFLFALIGRGLGWIAGGFAGDNPKPARSDAP